MAIKPILFNTEMSRAILDGRKTVTRRVIKEKLSDAVLNSQARRNNPHIPDKRVIERLCEPPYCIGDILWVRETWCELYPLEDDMCTPIGKKSYYYAADGFNPTPFNSFPDEDGRCGDRYHPRWRPSIHMPKEAARTFLRVTCVRVERLQDITDDACREEGIREWTKDGNLYKYYPADCEGDAPACEWQKCPRSLKGAMQMLWDSTIKKVDLQRYGWNANPWVWVIEFERCEKPEAFV